MKKAFLMSLLAAAVIYSLSGCATQNHPVTQTQHNPQPRPGAPTPTPDSQSTTNQPAPEPTNSKSTELQSREITDMGGNTVKIPPLSEIKHVVVLAPPVTSVLLDTIPDKKMIVGVNPKTFTSSNAEIMDKLLPNYKEIETTFVGDDFSINSEALLQLDPDLIFYYGDAEKKGLDNIQIPAIDFFSPKVTDPEALTVAWDRLLREIFEADQGGGLQKEWESYDKKVQGLLAKQNGAPKRALWIVSNAGGKLVVAGSNSFNAYAQSFFDKAGITNAASGIQGSAQVDMEQVYQWNPDVIFIFHSAPARAILDNHIKGQDWSLLDAWKNKAVYDIPRTSYSWGAPCADSPLMSLWLVSKAYPKLFSEGEFRTELSEYYQRLHHVSLTDQDITSALGLREMK